MAGPIDSMRHVRANSDLWRRDRSMRSSASTSRTNSAARSAKHLCLGLIRWVSLPGLTGQSSIHGQWLLVFHRAWPDLQRMKLLLLCAGVVGTEVGVLLVRLSPFTSWTRGSWSTSDCRHGPSSAPEHAS